MNPLLTALMLWIAANSSLPVPAWIPEVVQESPVSIACLLESVDPCDAAKLNPDWVWYAYYRAPLWEGSNGRIVVSSTIGLDGLIGHAILVHELVHHMQVAVGQTFDIECQAYQLEQKWLQERGSSLQEAFSMGEMFTLIAVTCYEP